MKTTITITLDDETNDRILAIVNEWARRTPGRSSTKTQDVTSILKSGLFEVERWLRSHPFKG